MCTFREVRFTYILDPLRRHLGALINSICNVHNNVKNHKILLFFNHINHKYKENRPNTTKNSISNNLIFSPENKNLNSLKFCQ